MGDTVIATVAGEIDGSNAAEVRRAVAERVPSTARSLVIDLSRTSYVDSTGVELLFELARRLSSRRQTFTSRRSGGLGRAAGSRALRHRQRRPPRRDQGTGRRRRRRRRALALERPGPGRSEPAERGPQGRRGLAAGGEDVGDPIAERLEQE